MTTIGTLHLVFSLLAIVFGAIVLLRPKGTRWHRTWGHGYVWSMIGLVVTSFLMYELTGSVTPFHLGAAVAAVTIAGGMNTVLRRRPKKNWLEAHAQWMVWSYVGLMAAFTAETLSRFVMPLVEPYLTGNSLWGAFWTLVGLASFAAFGVGAWLVRTRLPGAVAATPEAMRRERAELAEMQAGS